MDDFVKRPTLNLFNRDENVVAATKENLNCNKGKFSEKGSRNSRTQDK
jgi:hypothetical protein